MSRARARVPLDRYWRKYKMSERDREVGREVVRQGGACVWRERGGQGDHLLKAARTQRLSHELRPAQSWSERRRSD
eukprot:762080-Hanusia_phi.AAC.2